MPATVLFDLPTFDTGQYQDCDFLMSEGAATLTVHVTGLSSTSFRFHKVRWHQFTALYNCTAEMIRDAYFRLIEYKDSAAVSAFEAQDGASQRAYVRLHHYRIFLDETGCHEVFAESVTAL